MIRSLSRVICLCALLLAPGFLAPARAWSWMGHHEVARIALANVAPSTAKAVRRLIAHHALLETPQCRTATLDDAATWADCVRGQRDRFGHMAPWHQQDADVCKPFDLKGPCKDGNCVSAQIARQVRLLRDPALPERERVMALYLLIHFAGDLSQPLHGADRQDDGGGNGARVDYGIVPSVNLHKIWDYYLDERSITTPPGLVRVYSAQERAQATSGGLADWSREGWEIARDTVYPTALGPDFCDQPNRARGKLGNAQIEALIPVVRGQIVRGGLRLAALLDIGFGAVASQDPDFALPSGRR
jgi:hypothetical protein